MIPTSNTAKILAVAFLFILAGCSSQVVNVPINPYVDSEMAGRNVRRAAVMPFIIPSYMNGRDGGEAVSIEITNRFIAELSARGLYQIVDGDSVRGAIGRNYASPRDWIAKGDRMNAVHIAREVSADAVIIGTIKKYFQGNLTDSEVELEIECVDLAGTRTIWVIRELLVGKGGKSWLNETPFSIPPARLAELAVKDAADKAVRIRDEGGPINVTTLSPRKVGGSVLMAAGTVLTATGLYYYNEASKSYREYKDADSAATMASARNRTEDYDKAWQYIGGAGIAAFGGGLYLILTDHSALTSERDTERKVVVLPTATPDLYGLSLLVRF